MDYELQYEQETEAKLGTAFRQTRMHEGGISLQRIARVMNENFDESELALLKIELNKLKK